ncbi:hypothetical protein K1T71_004206 [Dendrolimus kikuchii]|uniref:Uncharacterized protein n=1 Tax=Dendrolimus kikuchii TaxID=765133 RepID=A0ACC1DBM1_9NEOP|nr:hypothetical protein K1T71_004206 [Dendrolimus kikuchii]
MYARMTYQYGVSNVRSGGYKSRQALGWSRRRGAARGARSGAAEGVSGDRSHDADDTSPVVSESVVRVGDALLIGVSVTEAVIDESSLMCSVSL